MSQLVTGLSGIRKPCCLAFTLVLQQFADTTSKQHPDSDNNHSLQKSFAKRMFMSECMAPQCSISYPCIIYLVFTLMYLFQSPLFYSPGVQSCPDSPSGKDAHGFGVQGLTLPAIQWVEYCLGVGLFGQRMAEITSRRRTKGPPKFEPRGICQLFPGHLLYVLLFQLRGMQISCFHSCYLCSRKAASSESLFDTRATKWSVLYVFWPAQTSFSSRVKVPGQALCMVCRKTAWKWWLGFCGGVTVNMDGRVAKGNLPKDSRSIGSSNNGILALHSIP